MRLSVLLRRDLVRSRHRLVVVSLAVAGSVALVVILAGIALGLYRGVVEPLLPRLPLDLLKVEPRTVPVGIMAFDAAALAGGLDDSALDRLRRIDGVKEVHPVVGAAFPMRAEGGEGFIGKRLRTDVFATGVPPDLVREDVAEGYSFESSNGARVPVLVARRLLDLYNTTVAPALAKPKLSEEAVIGFEFMLTVGASYARGVPNPRKVRRFSAQIVGFSDRATLVGVTVPEARLRAWNLDFGQETPLTGAYVRTDGPARTGPVSTAIEAAGLKVDDTAKVIGAGLAVAAALGWLFAGTLLFFAAFGTAQTFFLLVAERKRELVILRALGARQRDLRGLVLTEALVVGVLGAGFGVLAGSATALVLDRVVVGMLPDIPFKPAYVVSLPGTVLLGAAALGLLASVAGAWWPATRAAAAEPGQALRT